eukprot:CAMPEP_0115517900 /NCGR_PEP_ID=MMETSP0271-20121206/77567_1 /TAXON_ID=71861 /ORGANISM="Scrippsiella trochoidea, Strain CCMP3099" /LENGTH=221 /DNA_ID=CAMNT_0002948711 /DNA_START=1 /DNA_END=666 /DNA_ORIENTATION=+
MMFCLAMAFLLTCGSNGVEVTLNLDLDLLKSAAHSGGLEQYVGSMMKPLLASAGTALGGAAGIAIGCSFGGLLGCMGGGLVGPLVGQQVVPHLQEFVRKIVDLLVVFFNRLFGLDGCCVALRSLEMPCPWLTYPAPDTIHKSFRELSRIHHPDHQSGADAKANATGRMVELSAAAEMAERCSKSSLLERWGKADAGSSLGFPALVMVVILIIIGTKALGVL